MGICPVIASQNRIAIGSRGLAVICSHLDATILAQGPFGRQQRCEVRKLTPEEVALLPSRETS